MNIVKPLFTISLINFAFVSGLVISQTPTTSLVPSLPILTPTISPSLTLSPTTLPTSVPTLKPTARPTARPTAVPVTSATHPTTNPTSAPTAAVTQAPTAAPTTDPLAGHCIITVDGVRYDVTQFRFIHSGGDIFVCGADNTQIFYSRHNASTLSRMQQYKI